MVRDKQAESMNPPHVTVNSAKLPLDWFNFSQVPLAALEITIPVKLFDSTLV